MLPSRSVRFVCALENYFHGGNITRYLIVLRCQFFCEVNNTKPIRPINPIRPIIHDAKPIDAAAMRDNIMLQGGIPFVGLAENIAALHLVDVKETIVVLVYYVSENKHIIVEESCLKQINLLFFV